MEKADSIFDLLKVAMSEKRDVIKAQAGKWGDLQELP